MNNQITISQLYGSDFTENQLDQITSDEVIVSIELFVENGEYDFHGKEVKNLVISASGIKVKNAKVTMCMTVEQNCSNCYFENMRFESFNIPVVFGFNTSGAYFEKCKFVKLNNEDIPTGYVTEVKEGINDNLTFANCYFFRYQSLIKATHIVNCVFTGGWCDSVDYIIFNDGIEVNDTGTSKSVGLVANVIFTGFDFEGVKNIFRSGPIVADIDNKPYTQANIVINSILANATDGIIHFENGYINLICNVPILSTTKLFSDTSPRTCYCNIKHYGNSDYRFINDTVQCTIDVPLLAGESYYPLGNVHVINAYLEDTDADVTISLNGVILSRNIIIDEVGPLKVKNNSSISKVVKLKLTTKNVLVPMINNTTEF